MKCNRCNKNEATVFYKQNINGTVKEYALCSDCAKMEDLEITLPFAHLNLFGTKNSYVFEKKRCDLCGAAFEDIRKSGKVGCGKCYSVFENELKQTINSIHGANVHQNRICAEERKKNDEIEAIRKELKRAVENEDYEQAAVLRDRIKEMEGNI